MQFFPSNLLYKFVFLRICLFFFLQKIQCCIILKSFKGLNHNDILFRPGFCSSCFIFISNPPTQALEGVLIFILMLFWFSLVFHQLLLSETLRWVFNVLNLGSLLLFLSTPRQNWKMSYSPCWGFLTSPVINPPCLPTIHDNVLRDYLVPFSHFRLKAFLKRYLSASSMWLTFNELYKKKNPH